MLPGSDPMAQFHVNPKTGNSGACKAAHGKCPFGGDEIHFTSAAAAREAFERGQVTFNEQKPLKSLTFGGNTWKNVTLHGARYSEGGAIAIVAYSQGEYGDEPLTDVTVNLDELGAKPAPGAFFIKDWSENSGLAESLEKAGVIELTGESVQVNQWGSKALEARLTPKYKYLSVDSDWEKVTEEHSVVTELDSSKE